MRKIWKIGRGLFGVAILSALGVGVTQVFAAPAPTRTEAACNRFLCMSDCYGKGATHGECIGGECVCT